jgi:RNA polymerase sigma-70 factor (ECF subfamily)
MNKATMNEAGEGADRHERFLALFLRQQPQLRAFIRAVLPGPGPRDDVMQEVSLALWRAFDRYDPARPFGPWARGVATKVVLKSLRTGRRVPVLISSEVLESLLDAFDRAEPEPPDTTHLRSCVDLLPQRSRQLVRLRYEEGMGLPAIAAHTELSVEAVHKALFRIRHALRNCIQRRTLAEQRVS